MMRKAGSISKTEASPPPIISKSIELPDRCSAELFEIVTWRFEGWGLKHSFFGPELFEIVAWRFKDFWLKASGPGF